MLLGHWVGKTLDDRMIEEFKHWFIAGAIALACLFAAYLVWRHKVNQRNAAAKNAREASGLNEPGRAGTTEA
jgi:ABC-type nickel/cobalt efflux system permease component RcnA